MVIDTKNKFLYYVEEGGKAIRMGVGVGREGFGNLRSDHSLRWSRRTGMLHG